MPHHCIGFGHYQQLSQTTTGGPSCPTAQARTLTTMVGGSQLAARRCELLFHSFSRHVVYLGGPGSGQTAKLFNHALLKMNQANIADTVELGASFGMDPSRVVDVLTLGSASCTTYTWPGTTRSSRALPAGVRVIVAPRSSSCEGSRVNSAAFSSWVAW